MVRNLLIVAAVLAAFASSSRAQFFPPQPIPTPGGGVVIPGGPFGNTTVITPDRLNNPLSNMPIPGTQSSYAQYVPGLGWVYGSTYIGADGKPHGTNVTPNGTGGTTTTNYLTIPKQGSSPKTFKPLRP